jgi:hypothetical protein
MLHLGLLSATPTPSPDAQAAATAALQSANHAAWATLAAAAIAAAGVLYSANKSLKSADRSAEAAEKGAKSAASAAESSAEITAAASRFVPLAESFADWQAYKRKVYTELLVALRAYRASQSSEAREQLEVAFDAAILAGGYHWLFNHLTKIRASIIQSNDLSDVDDQALMQHLRDDVKTTPQQASARKRAEQPNP